MIGQTLGHYRIVEKIGAGGMGEVYRARDEHLGRDVAIKVLPAGTLADDSARRRFRAEAEALARLNHPHIATVHDFATQDGTDFLVMEFVPGSSLSDRLATGSLPEKEVLRLAMQVAAALQEAHENRIVHRDLKPANIRLTAKGDAKVLDFGLAKLLRPVDDINTQSLTQSQAVVGTLPYMAPEQLRAEAADARTDIYAFGCVLYEMVTARRPFRETVSATLTDAILNRPASSPRQLTPQLSSELERIILKCLEKDPEDRYQSAKELSVDLRRLATPTPGAVIPSGVPMPVGTESRDLLVSPTRSVRRVALPAVAAAVVLAAIIGFNVGGVRERLFTPAVPQIDSIAVLPLDNLSRDPEQDYFADGLTEALITELSKISALKVVSRTSAMQYKGVKKPMPQIARELGVDGVVEGSVAREGDQVRITVQLIHGPTDKHLWAESYQRELRGILALQSEVARAIARRIEITLTPAEQSQLTKARTVNPAAHEAYLLGRFYVNKRTDESLEKAVAYFDQAVRIDPDFALGYAGLGYAYMERTIWGDVLFSQSEPLIRQAVLKALELDDSLAEGHTVLGALKSIYDWDWDGAEKEHQRALQLNPNYADGHMQYAYLLLHAGRFGEAIQHIERARELDPLSATVHSDVGRVYYRARQYETAIEYYRKAMELDPAHVPVYGRLADAYEMLGRYEEAESALEEGSRAAGPHSRRNVAAFGYLYAVTGRKRRALDAIQDLRQRGPQASYQIALIYLGLGEKDQAMAWLEKAQQERVFLDFVKTEPKLDPLRDDPRFQDLLRRMNFPEN